MEQRAVKIQDGIVTNVLVIDDNTPKDFYDMKLEDGANVGVGWKFEDGEFIQPEQPKLDDDPESA